MEADMRSFRWLALGPALVLAVGTVPVPVALHAQNSPGLTARVTFLDGSSVTLQRPRLVYTFGSWNRRQFINAGTADTAVDALHYATDSSGHRVYHAIPLDSIRELRLAYRTLRPPVESETTIVRQRMTVVLRSRRDIVIDQPLFGRLSSVLPPSLAGTTTDSALFDRLSLQGELVGPGRTAASTILLFRAGAPANDRYLPRAERQNETCHSCRPRRAIVQMVSFLP
jgi:hypothetical protein